MSFREVRFLFALIRAVCGLLLIDGYCNECRWVVYFFKFCVRVLVLRCVIIIKVSCFFGESVLGYLDLI